MVDVRKELAEQERYGPDTYVGELCGRAVEEIDRLREVICAITNEDDGCVFASYKDHVDLAYDIPVLLEVHKSNQEGE